MNLRHAILAAPLALLAACAGDETTIHTLSTGTFAVSGATAANTSPGDGCGLLDLYAPQPPEEAKQFGATVTGSSIAFDFTFRTPIDPDTVITASLTDNAIATTDDADFLANPGGDCSVRTVRSVTGSLTSVDAMELTMDLTSTVESGDCSAWGEYPCTSNIQFLATTAQ